MTEKEYDYRDYPEEHRDMLKLFGCPDIDVLRAQAFNRELIRLSTKGVRLEDVVEGLRREYFDDSFDHEEYDRLREEEY